MQLLPSVDSSGTFEQCCQYLKRLVTHFDSHAVLVKLTALIYREAPRQLSSQAPRSFPLYTAWWAGSTLRRWPCAMNECGQLFLEVTAKNVAASW